MWSTVLGYISILVLGVIIKGHHAATRASALINLLNRCTNFFPFFSDGINRLTEGRRAVLSYLRMKPVVAVSRAEEVTSQQQQLEQQQQADRTTPTSAAAPAPLRPVIISLTSQSQPPEAGAGAAVLLPRNKNVLKERFILKNCTTTAADSLSRLKVRIVLRITKKARKNLVPPIIVADPHPDPTDPDPQDPCVFGPPGSFCQKYGSGSFYHQAKILRKTLIPPVL
jgi:hypothetical protein